MLATALVWEFSWMVFKSVIEVWEKLNQRPYWFAYRWAFNALVLSSILASFILSAFHYQEKAAIIQEVFCILSALL
jgi:hypothetical protein